MRNFINDVFFILGEKKNKLITIFFLFFNLSILEVFSISILAPYISFINKPNIFHEKLGEIGFFNEYLQNFSLEVIFILIGIFIILIFLFKTLLFLYISKKILSFTWEVQIYIRKKLIYKYQNLKYEIFQKKNSAELVTKLLRLIGLFNGRVVQHLLKVTSELIILSGIFFLLLFTNYKILIILIIVCLTLGIVYYLLFNKKLIQYGKKANISYKNTLKYLNEIFGAFKELKILSKENYFRKLFIKESKNFADYSIKESLIIISPRLIIEFAIIVMVISASIIFVYFQTSFFSTNDLMIYAISALRVIPSLNTLVSSISHIRYGKSTVDDLKIEFMNYERDIQTKNKKAQFLNGKEVASKIKTFEFRNINFSYDNKKIVFKDSNLYFEKGKLYGISGSSGAGKSTLVNILLGLYKCKNGEIYIDNKKIMNNELPQDLFFYIPQDFHIFDESLEFNISLSDKANLDLITHSIKSAQLENLVKSLPEKTQSMIGEKGTNISGGERQRVALARSFYFNREILIFDESTNGLDQKTEIEIFETLKHISNQKIILVISHKIDILEKYCNEIYKIKNLEIKKFK